MLKSLNSKFELVAIDVESQEVGQYLKLDVVVIVVGVIVDFTRATIFCDSNTSVMISTY